MSEDWRGCIHTHLPQLEPCLVLLLLVGLLWMDGLAAHLALSQMWAMGLIWLC